MSDNLNENLSQKDLDDLALLGVNDDGVKEDSAEPPLFKGQNAVRWVVVGFSGMSSAAIVNAAIKNNVHPANKFGKLQLVVGCACIGGLVSAAVQQNVGEAFDSLINTARNLLTEEV